MLSLFFTSDHECEDVVDAAVFDGDVGIVFVVVLFLVGETGVAVVFFFHALDVCLVEGGKLLRCGFQHGVIRQEHVGVFVENDVTVVKHVKIVAEIFEIAGNVRADEDGALIVFFHESAQLVEEIVARQRIEPSGRLVQDEQLGVVAGGDEHFELGEHTGGKLVDLFLERQIHLICPAQKIIFVKMIEERGQDGHDVCDREMAVEAGARMIGVNNRNLKDFSVDTENSRRLRSMIPAEVLFVSESGVRDENDVRKLREIGADAVLIGEALMRAEDKKAKLAALRG